MRLVLEVIGLELNEEERKKGISKDDPKRMPAAQSQTYGMLSRGMKRENLTFSDGKTTLPDWNGNKLEVLFEGKEEEKTRLKNFIKAHGNTFGCELME